MEIENLPFDVYIEEGRKILGEYIEACQWLDSIGIPHHITRFGNYREEIDSFSQKLKSLKDKDERLNLFHAYLNAQAEAIELLRIKKNLQDQRFELFIEKLKKVTSGHVFRDSVISDQSRDIGFELTMASRFISGGYTVDLNQLADLVANVNGRRIFVECKRVKSKKKFEKRLKEANKQLRRRLDSDISSLSRGIVAINLTDIINPNNEFYVVNDPYEIKKLNSDLLDAYILKQERVLNERKTKNSLGVLCEAISHSFIPRRNPPAICNCRGIKFFRYHLKEADVNLVRVIAGSIANQSII